MQETTHRRRLAGLDRGLTPEARRFERLAAIRHGRLAKLANWLGDSRVTRHNARYL